MKTTKVTILMAVKDEFGRSLEYGVAEFTAKVDLLNEDMIVAAGNWKYADVKGTRVPSILVIRPEEDIIIKPRND